MQKQVMGSSRRQFLGFSGTALFSSVLPAHFAAQSNAGDTAPLQALLHRVLGPAATQIHLAVKPSAGGERFDIAGTAGEIRITGTTKSATLAGVNWYLNYVAGAYTVVREFQPFLAWSV